MREARAHPACVSSTAAWRRAAGISPRFRPRQATSPATAAADCPAQDRCPVPAFMPPPGRRKREPSWPTAFDGRALDERSLPTRSLDILQMAVCISHPFSFASSVVLRNAPPATFAGRDARRGSVGVRWSNATTQIFMFQHFTTFNLNTGRRRRRAMASPNPPPHAGKRRVCGPPAGAPMSARESREPMRGGAGFQPASSSVAKVSCTGFGRTNAGRPAPAMRSRKVAISPTPRAPASPASRPCVRPAPPDRWKRCPVPRASPRPARSRRDGRS